MYFSNQEQKAYNPDSRKQVKTDSVKVLDKAGFQIWDHFAKTHCTHPFSLSIWKDLYENFFGLKTYYLYIEQSKTITAILPLVEMKSWLFGNALISTPFWVYGGPVGDPKDSQLLMDRAIEIAQEKKVDYLEIKSEHSILDSGWSQEIYYNFQKTLANNHDDNLKDIPRKQRAVIRKAIQSSLTTHFEDNINNFYRLYAESLRNLGTPIMSKSFYQKVFDMLGENCKVLTVFDKAKPISSVFTFYHQGCVLPYYAGGAADARNNKAHDFMYWQLMCDATEKGLTTFNFGRSKKDTGAFRFKKHWGFTPELLGYRTIPIQTNTPPNLNPTNPKYQLMIKTWQKLPLALSTIIGPHVARRLG